MLKYLLEQKYLSASGSQLCAKPLMIPKSGTTNTIDIFNVFAALEVTQFSCHLRQVETLSCCMFPLFCASSCPIAVLIIIPLIHSLFV